MATMKPTLTPYLNFNGNTAEAMRFYQSILGGELTIQTFGEAKMAKSPKEKDLILHADLNNDALSITASAGQPSVNVVVGNNIHLSLAGQEHANLAEMLTKL